MGTVDGLFEFLVEFDKLVAELPNNSVVRCISSLLVNFIPQGKEVVLQSRKRILYVNFRKRWQYV